MNPGARPITAALAYLARWRREPRHDDPPPGNADAGRAAVPGILGALRMAALILVTILVVSASVVSFAESYRGLYVWARHHGLSGVWAALWPVQVDVFIAVGELALFIALIDQWRGRARVLPWLITVSGLAVSVAANIGHVTSTQLTTRATASVPPLAAAAALAAGLGVLKRVVSQRRASTPGDQPGTENGVVLPQVPTDAEVAALLALRATTWAGNPLSGRQLETRFGLSRVQVTRVRRLVAAEANGHPYADPAGEDATAA
jgi:hypothetical protein